MSEDFSQAEDNTLNRLVSSLSLEERNEFLEKLKIKSTLSFESLYEAADENEKYESLEVLYTKLPWYSRFFYYLISIVKNISPSKVFEEEHVARLGRFIQIKTPGLYNYQQKMLLSGFFELLMDLKEAARFFFTALDCSVNQDKGSFYAFLGSLEMGDVHLKLQNDTTAKAILDINPDASESEIRSSALRVMEEAFGEITEVQRNVMYYNARSLNCLKELSAFPFDRLLLSFGHSGGQTCPVGAVRELLVNLNNILFSLKDPPTLSLLESLFVFQLHGRKGEDGFNMDNETHKLLSASEEAIAALRYFNRKVPLTRILRCAFRDMSLAPRQISGGEDWFLVYQEYWKRHIDTLLAEFIHSRKRREIQASFKYFIKDTPLKVLEHTASDNNRDGIPLAEAFTLGFLRSFHSSVFMTEIATALKPILIEGEFFKRENRAEFTGAYNDLMRIDEDVSKLDRKMSPEGDCGKRYAQAKNDISALPVKRKRVQLVLDEVTREAKGIILRTISAAMMMVNVLNGILRKEAGGKYDTLSNLDELGGKDQVAFLVGINTTIKQLQQFLETLKEIETMGNVNSIL
ncbi:MAG: DUF5312 domain-containing protein [Treponema sp.]|jgi:hypothetical protein|nr:DUF5312 domain-containing protein [Treponema sp.]